MKRNLKIHMLWLLLCICLLGPGSVWAAGEEKTAENSTVILEGELPEETFAVVSMKELQVETPAVVSGEDQQDESPAATPEEKSVGSILRTVRATNLGQPVAFGVEEDSLQAQTLRVYLAKKEAEEAAKVPTEIQKEIAERAENNRGTVSATHGRCAAWVSGIYQAADLGYPGGNAIDYWHRWKASGSPDCSDIPLGAVVVGSGSKSESGRTYGHVGIYIGDGRIAHNVGGGKATISTIEEFESYYCSGDLSLCDYSAYRGWKGILGWVWPWGDDLSVQ